MNTYRASRFSFFAILLTVLTLLCSTGPANARFAPSSAIADQFFSAVGTGNTFSLLSAGAVLHTPEGDFIGREGPARFGNALDGSFSNVEFATNSVEYVESLLIVDFTLTGINTGSYQGVSANCAGIAVPGVAVLMVQEDRVVEQWIGYDSDAVASQIAAFNAFDPNTRPGCADHVTSQNEASSEPTYQPAPSCNKATQCELPY